MSLIFYLLLFTLLIFLLLSEILVRKGKLKFRSEYSFKIVFWEYGKYSVWVFIISLIFYLYSKSAEAAIGIFAFLFSCTVAGFLKSILMEYQVKRRADREKQDALR